jgi:hypothetical protein
MDYSMSSSSSRFALWLGFLLSAAIAIGFCFYPAFIIRPFSHQTHSGLQLAMAFRQRAPFTSLAAGMLGLLFALMLWGGGWARKTIITVLMLLVTFSAVMTRLNYFEWMFHPIENAQFESESASKLANSEMILAVRFGNDARAYPISQMAYHHILNDVVDGVPVAVTY